MRTTILGIAAAVLLTAVPGASAASAPDAGVPFVPKPRSAAIYGVKRPEADLAHQRHVVRAADGVDLFVETWLPEAKDGHVPPAHVPTILIATPYVDQGALEYPGSHGPHDTNVIAYFVSRGYAVAQHHVRGTGQSGGCIEQTALREPDDFSRVIEYLGRDAPWADGNVGMYGISYDAETQVSVAGFGDRNRTKYLKAIIPVATVGGEYEYAFFDGVPLLGEAQATMVNYLLDSVSTSMHINGSSLQHYLEKFPCQPQFATESLLSGDYTQYWNEHELRKGAPNFTVPTLWVHGLADWNVKDIAEAGFFDRIPASTPHKGIFGIWEHAFPEDHEIQADWARADWMPAALAWYDRYLKGIKTGVDKWPPVQVQSTDGQWRAEPQWPTVGGRAGQLALGTGGYLGDDTPAGSDRYSEESLLEFNLGEVFGGLLPTGSAPTIGSPLVYDTPVLGGPLHITGQPELDLWFTTDDPAARIAAKMEAFDAAGKPVPNGFDYGYRSARHLDPLVDNGFAQALGRPAPTAHPIHVPLRFHPIDLIVPKGGHLRLTFAGSVANSFPSVTPGNITVLHDCLHPTALRFVMPHVNAPLMNVREWDEPAEKPLHRHSAPKLQVDGAGLARKPVCGAAPKRDTILGPTRPAVKRR